jgi:uncharacterized protein YdhG (YjbR/CyaY superfamily)
MPAKTVSDYLKGLPDERRKAIAAIRKAIKQNLPDGFKESIGMGMIIWSVPHSSYPAGYHCDPSKPLMLIGLSTTKNGISLHHMGIYGSTALLKWFRSEWSKHSDKKLDMGKACIRFKKLDEVPIDLIGQLASKLTPHQWVEHYERMLGARAAKH